MEPMITSTYSSPTHPKLHSPSSFAASRQTQADIYANNNGQKSRRPYREIIFGVLRIALSPLVAQASTLFAHTLKDNKPPRADPEGQNTNDAFIPPLTGGGFCSLALRSSGDSPARGNTAERTTSATLPTPPLTAAIQWHRRSTGRRTTCGCACLIQITGLTQHNTCSRNFVGGRARVLDDATRQLDRKRAPVRTLIEKITSCSGCAHAPNLPPSCAARP